MTVPFQREGGKTQLDCGPDPLLACGIDRVAPDDLDLPLAMARVMQWLALSENEIQYGLARARAALQFGAPWNVEECQRVGRGALQLLQGRLETAEWLAAEHITIADLACYPYVALAPQSGVELASFPAVTTWVGRVQALPRYAGMPNMFVAADK